MKQLALALLLAAVVAVPHAEARYFGLLDRAPWELQVIGGAQNGSDLAVTVTWVRRGNLDLLDTFTVGPGQTGGPGVPYPMPQRVTRIIITVDLAGGSSATVRLNSNGTLTEEPISEAGGASNTLVYDIRP